MTDEEYDKLRRPVLEVLSILRKDYERMAKPYIDQLARIENARPVRVMLDVSEFVKENTNARKTD